MFGVCCNFILFFFTGLFLPHRLLVGTVQRRVAALGRILAHDHENSPKNGPKPTNKGDKELQKTNENIRKISSHETTNHGTKTKKNAVGDAQTNLGAAHIRAKVWSGESFDLSPRAIQKFRHDIYI